MRTIVNTHECWRHVERTYRPPSEKQSTLTNIHDLYSGRRLRLEDTNILYNREVRK